MGPFKLQDSMTLLAFVIISYAVQAVLLQCDRENRERLKYLRNVIVLQEKSQSGVRKLNRKQER